MAQPTVSLDLRIAEVSRSHLDTPHSIGLLWTSDRPVAQTPLPHNRHTSMPPVTFEPAISASKRPQTHASDRAATGIGSWMVAVSKLNSSIL